MFGLINIKDKQFDRCLSFIFAPNKISKIDQILTISI